MRRSYRKIAQLMIWVTLFPFMFPPAVLAASQINLQTQVQGVLPIANGGTGNASGIVASATTAASATYAVTAGSVTTAASATYAVTAGSAVYATNAITQGAWDASSAVTNDQAAQAMIQRTMSTLPLNVSGVSGNLSFDSIGSGCILTFTTTGGAITGISLIPVGGSNYNVGDLLVVNMGNQDAVLDVLTLGASSSVASLGILYGGTGYTNGGSITSSGSASVPYTFTLTGVPSGNITFLTTYGTRLTQSNQWYVNNNTTGANTVTFKLGNASDAASGVGATIPQGTNNAAQISTDGVTDLWCVGGICGANLGTPTAINISNATGSASGVYAQSAVNAVAATNIAGGTQYQMPYQSSAGVSAFATSGVSMVMVTGATGIPAASSVLPNINHGTPSAIVLTNGTGLPYSGLTGSVPTWNQNTTGAASSVLGGTVSATTGTFSGLLTAQSGITATGTVSATTFSGAGTSLTGTGASFTAGLAQNLTGSPAITVSSCAGCGGGSSASLQSLTITEAASAVTIAIPSQTLAFRSTNLSNGAVSSVTAAPVNFTIPQGATLGTINAVSSIIAILEVLPSSGVPMIAAVNIVSGVNLDETQLINTVAVTSSSTSVSSVYAAATLASVPFRVIGYGQFNEATAGNWVSLPYQVQGIGGLAGIGMFTGLGTGQTWTNVVSSRSNGVTYYNTSTIRPIYTCPGVTSNTAFYIGSANITNSAGPGAEFCGIVQPGMGYSVQTIYNTIWWELK